MPPLLWPTSPPLPSPALFLHAPPHRIRGGGARGRQWPLLSCRFSPSLLPKPAASPAAAPPYAATSGIHVCALCPAAPQSAPLRFRHATARDPRRLRRARSSSPHRLLCGLPSLGTSVPKVLNPSCWIIVRNPSSRCVSNPISCSLVPSTATFS
jgi:hypothetical protein